MNECDGRGAAPAGHQRQLLRVQWCEQGLRRARLCGVAVERAGRTPHASFGVASAWLLTLLPEDLPWRYKRQAVRASTSLSTGGSCC